MPIVRRETLRPGGGASSAAVVQEEGGGGGVGWGGGLGQKLTDCGPASWICLCACEAPGRLATEQGFYL